MKTVYSLKKNEIVAFLQKKNVICNICVDLNSPPPLPPLLVIIITSLPWIAPQMTSKNLAQWFELFKIKFSQLLAGNNMWIIGVKVWNGLNRTYFSKSSKFELLRGAYKIRQKSESLNGGNKKTKHIRFSLKTNIFYSLICTRTCVRG